MTTNLNLCGDPERTRLLNEMADNLGEWINDNYAHLELEYWIPCYTKLRGTLAINEMSSRKSRSDPVEGFYGGQALEGNLLSPISVPCLLTLLAHHC